MMKRRKQTWDKERVRALRKHLELTQVKLADELGIRQQTISDWEKGIYQPRGASTTLLNIIAERSDFKYKAEKDEGESD